MADLQRMVNSARRAMVEVLELKPSDCVLVDQAERLIVAAERTDTRIVIPKVGQMFEPASPPAMERWWPDVPWRKVIP